MLGRSAGLDVRFAAAGKARSGSSAVGRKKAGLFMSVCCFPAVGCSKSSEFLSTHQIIGQKSGQRVSLLCIFILFKRKNLWFFCCFQKSKYFCTNNLSIIKNLVNYDRQRQARQSLRASGDSKRPEVRPEKPYACIFRCNSISVIIIPVASMRLPVVLRVSHRARVCINFLY